MMRHLLFMSCHVYLITSQILERPRSEVIVLNQTQPIQYCNLLHKDRDMYTLSDLDMYNRVGAKVHLYTYISGEILDYAPEAAAINSWYATRQNYSFYVYTPSTGHNFEPSDQRWNKVKILLDAMYSHPLGSVLVWIDADLIIIDLDFDILQVTHHHSEADIFMSKDGPGAPTIANTGMIIVRNSKWTRDFFRRWWLDSNRPTECDQIALSHLYQSVLSEEGTKDTPSEQKRHPIGVKLLDNQEAPSVRRKFAILRQDALNSHFPAWQHQLTHNQILHLAGLSDSYRYIVFQKALLQLCMAAVSAQLSSTVCVERFRTRAERIWAREICIDSSGWGNTATDALLIERYTAANAGDFTTIGDSSVNRADVGVHSTQNHPHHTEKNLNSLLYNPQDPSTNTSSHTIQACRSNGHLPHQLGLTRPALSQLYSYSLHRHLEPLVQSIEQLTQQLQHVESARVHYRRCSTITPTNEVCSARRSAAASVSTPLTSNHRCSHSDNDDDGGGREKGYNKTTSIAMALLPWERLWMRVQSVHSGLLDMLKRHTGYRVFHKVQGMLVWCVQHYEILVIEMYHLHMRDECKGECDSDNYTDRRDRTDDIDDGYDSHNDDSCDSGSGSCNRYLSDDSLLDLLEKVRVAISSAFDMVTYVNDAVRLQDSLRSDSSENQTSSGFKSECNWSGIDVSLETERSLVSLEHTAKRVLPLFRSLLKRLQVSGNTAPLETPDHSTSGSEKGYADDSTEKEEKLTYPSTNPDTTVIYGNDMIASPPQQGTSGISPSKLTLGLVQTVLRSGVYLEFKYYVFLLSLQERLSAHEPKSDAASTQTTSTAARRRITPSQLHDTMQSAVSCWRRYRELSAWPYLAEAHHNHHDHNFQSAGNPAVRQHDSQNSGGTSILKEHNHDHEHSRRASPMEGWGLSGAADEVMLRDILVVREGSEMMAWLATALCADVKGRELEGALLFDEVRKQREVTLQGLQEHREAHVFEIGSEEVALAVDYANSGACVASIGRHTTAHSHIQSSVRLFERYLSRGIGALSPFHADVYGRLKSFLSRNGNAVRRAATTNTATAATRTAFATSINAGIYMERDGGGYGSGESPDGKIDNSIVESTGERRSNAALGTKKRFLKRKEKRNN